MRRTRRRRRRIGTVGGETMTVTAGEIMGTMKLDLATRTSICFLNSRMKDKEARRKEESKMRAGAMTMAMSMSTTTTHVPTTICPSFVSLLMASIMAPTFWIRCGRHERRIFRGHRARSLSRERWSTRKSPLCLASRTDCWHKLASLQPCAMLRQNSRHRWTWRQ